MVAEEQEQEQGPEPLSREEREEWLRQCDDKWSAWTGAGMRRALADMDRAEREIGRLKALCADKEGHLSGYRRAADADRSEMARLRFGVQEQLRLIRRLNESRHVSVYRDGRRVQVPSWDAVQDELDALVRFVEGFMPD